jgi:hypothetical protein
VAAASDEGVLLHCMTNIILSNLTCGIKGLLVAMHGSGPQPCLNVSAHHFLLSDFDGELGVLKHQTFVGISKILLLPIVLYHQPLVDIIVVIWYQRLSFKFIW